MKLMNYLQNRADEFLRVYDEPIEVGDALIDQTECELKKALNYPFGWNEPEDWLDVIEYFGLDANRYELRSVMWDIIFCEGLFYYYLGRNHIIS